MDRQLLIRGVLEWMHINSTGSLFLKSLPSLCDLVESHGLRVSNDINHMAICFTHSEF